MENIGDVFRRVNRKRGCWWWASALRILCAPTLDHELVTNRTRLIRDAALDSGKTCIACGRDAVGKVGDYPVCILHQTTVTPPDPLQHWKRNVRNRHGRIPRRACQLCGRRRGLTHHHEWKGGEPGHPPRPIILCRRCHRIADHRPSGRSPWPSRPFRARITNELLNYCERDTWAMVKVLEKLRELARG